MKKVTEKQFLGQVRKLARMNGWLEYHTYDSRRSTPGFPDICMVRGRRVVFAELKVGRGRLTGAQRRWLDALERSCCEVYVWFPEDWDSIQLCLRR